jgi:hypothetical protein
VEPAKPWTSNRKKRSSISNLHDDLPLPSLGFWARWREFLATEKKKLRNNKRMKRVMEAVRVLKNKRMMRRDQAWLQIVDTV